MYRFVDLGLTERGNWGLGEGGGDGDKETSYVHTVNVYLRGATDHVAEDFAAFLTEDFSLLFIQLSLRILLLPTSSPRWVRFYVAPLYPRPLLPTLNTPNQPLLHTL
ncbi:hypothetical protein BaRGS_00007842 [Batillaria attramentaria]|uniref:Uncharacterized protein n=1 Tax=Batillaria attramentaria TaxID=370345 RepID=A0ABD0LNQ3_9CAEN